MNLKSLTSLLVVLCIVSLDTASAQNKARNRKSAKETTVEKVDSTATKYKKFLNEPHESKSGLLVVTRAKGKVYFEIPDSLLGRDMLLGSTIVSTSDNGFGIVGAKLVKPLHFRFTAEGDDKVAMRLVSEDVITLPGNPGISNALRAGSAGAIYKLFKIEFRNPDNGAPIVDVTDLFLSHDKYLSPIDSRGVNAAGGRNKITESFSKEKSYIENIKSFDDNVSVISCLSYSISVSGSSVAEKNIPFTTTVNRSIIMLDKEPCRPRITDSRIGIFPTAKTEFSNESSGSKTIYYANRWRLEPSDTAAYRRGELVEPVKPIKFYVDNNFPSDWLPYIIEGVRQWSEVFEEIGFKNAVQAEVFPVDDPDFDPDNLRYSCVRYAPVSIRNAMGPSWVDPRSGEIVNASVYIYHDVARLINTWLFIQTSPADPRVRHTVIAQDIFGDAIRYVTSHEIGHCLGFMHNMSASAVIPTDSLRSAAYTRKYGTTTSIMDYARFNYVAQPEDSAKGLKLTPPRFGEYDRYLVRWSYTPLFCDTAWEEYKITSGWISEASQYPVYRYGKQQAKVLDPRSQTEDIGDDAMKSSRYGISNLKYIVSNMNTWLENEDRDYSYRKTLYSGIVTQYYIYLSHVYANVGGIYLREKHAGDHVDAAVAVPRDRQQKALQFMFNQLEDTDWLDNRSVTDNIGLVGSTSGMAAELIMKLIIAAPDAIAKSESLIAMPFTSEDCAQEVFEYVWNPAKNVRKLNPTQMKFQRLYLQNACAQTGIQLYPKAKSFYSEDLFAELVSVFGYGADEESAYEQLLGYPCSCSHHDFDDTSHQTDEISGYGAPRALFSSTKSQSSMGYAYMTEARRLMEKNRNHPDPQTRMHYRSLLNDLEHALNSK